MTVDLDQGYTRTLIEEADSLGMLRNQLAYVLATAQWETEVFQWHPAAARRRRQRPVRLAFLALILAGCTPHPSPDLNGAYVIFFCGINCPLNVFVNDDGRITDAIPQEQPHMMPEAIDAIQD